MFSFCWNSPDLQQNKFIETVYEGGKGERREREIKASKVYQKQTFGDPGNWVTLIIDAYILQLRTIVKTESFIEVNKIHI